MEQVPYLFGVLSACFVLTGVSQGFLRAVACVIVWVTTVVGMIAYEHCSVDEPPSGAFTVAVATAAALLMWLVTGLD
jgi:hypothetical protein